MELAGRRKDLAARGLGLAAISPDSILVLRDFAARRGVAFPLLSDADSAIIRAFGLLNEEIAPGEPHFGIPHPGTLVIDAKGVVTERDFAEGYAERRTVASLLDMRDGDPATRVDASGGITVTLSASDATAAMGRRLTLFADLTLPKDTHLYAPGSDGYTALDLVIDPHPVVTPETARLPRPRILRFKATDERLPVFDGPTVRISLDVLVAGGRPFVEWLGAKPEELVLTGRLAFQSCSKTSCQPPASVPVSWTFRAAAPDFERSPDDLRPSAERDLPPK